MNLRPVAVMAALALAALAKAQPADRIWSGGTILRMNDVAMRAHAVAERGSRIFAVGTREQVMKLRGPDTRDIDLKGRTLLSGFVDEHGNSMGDGLQGLLANLQAPLDGKVSEVIASLQQTLRDWMAANGAAVRKANLVVGFGYEPATLAEQRRPTRCDLDAASKDAPIIGWAVGVAPLDERLPVSRRQLATVREALADGAR